MSKIQIVKDNINLINRLRTEGKSNQYIANQLGLSRSYLLHTLRKLDVKVEAQGYPIEKKQQIIELYTQGFGYKYIEANVKVSDRTIKKVLLEAGVPVNNKRVELLPELSEVELINILNSNLDITVDTFNPFTNLSSDTTQYWLGYLAADGCITNSYISISSIDYKTLLSFRAFIKSKNKIYQPKSNGYNSSTVCHQFSKGSQKWCKFLHQLGLVPRKTKTLRMRINITFSFLRGLLDGDGTVLLPPPNQYSGSVRWFTASKEFAYQIIEFLEQFMDVNLYTREKGYEIVVGNKESIRRLYNYLYTIDSISLARKKDKYKKLREALFGNK